MFKSLKALAVITHARLYFADYTPTVNPDGARNMVEQFVKPATTVALWAIPILGILAILVAGIKYFSSDEDTQEQKPIGKTIVKYIKWIIILEAIPAILKIFGL